MAKKYMSEARMRRYFSHQLAWRYATFLFVLAVVCIILFYLSLNVLLYQLYYIIHNMYYLLYIGAVALVSGTVVLLISYLMIPSDGDFDDWLAEQENMVAANMLTKLRLDQKQIISPPLVIHGFVWYSSELAEKRYNKKVYSKIGRDGRIRFSVNTLLYFVPVEHHIAAFYTDINAIERYCQLNC